MVVLMLLMLASCHESYTPKPRGYFRIDLPESSYVKFDSAGFPYSFEYPVYASVSSDPYAPDQKYWLNINYPEFKATLHLSYKPVQNDLVSILNDAYTLVSKHISKADAIYDSLVINPDKKVYGTVFDIEGIGVASPYQFYVTDSTSHYLRGALYFNVHPNNDSLKPVIQFIKKDIDHFISSLSWKNYGKDR
jgi:gliding motility-associated lipoprotein GldD